MINVTRTARRESAPQDGLHEIENFVSPNHTWYVQWQVKIWPISASQTGHQRSEDVECDGAHGLHSRDVVDQYFYVPCQDVQLPIFKIFKIKSLKKLYMRNISWIEKVFVKIFK